MALTIEYDDIGVVSVEECFEYALDNVDINCTDSMASAAPYLAGVAKNRDLVAEHLVSELKAFAGPTANTTYSPHSFTLSKVHPSFLIRANVWIPISSEPGRRKELEQRILAYRQPHDHNFSFLTVGYFGSGYQTEIYEYDYHSTEGYIGEQVPLKFLEKTRLETGKAMLYRSGVDIHSQYPPEDISVSLNLIVTTPEERSQDQYYFDLDAGRISEYSDTACSKRVSLLSLAAYLSTDNTIELLEHIAQNHPCRRTRLQALMSLEVAAPSDMDRWQKLATADSFPMVRSFLDKPYQISNYGWVGRGKAEPNNFSSQFLRSL